MSGVSVYVICEGTTEQTFVQQVLSPEFGTRNVWLHGQRLGLPGHKGGNVQFERLVRDAANCLRQRSDSYITTMLDLYGIAPDWPGVSELHDLKESGARPTAVEIGRMVNERTAMALKARLGEYDIERRFIPYIQVYEFEALLFSDADSLSKVTSISKAEIQRIRDAFDSPEDINEGVDTAPSKRLLRLSDAYRKTSTGVTAAKAIGLKKMREECKHFDAWVKKLELLEPL